MNMSGGWSPGSRFFQSGSQEGGGIGGSGITLGRDGTYRDAGRTETWNKKNPKPILDRDPIGTDKSKQNSWNKSMKPIRNSQYNQGAPLQEMFVTPTPPQEYQKDPTLDTDLMRRLNKARAPYKTIM